MVAASRLSVATARLLGTGALQSASLSNAISQLLHRSQTQSAKNGTEIVAAVLLATPHFAAADLENLPAQVRRLLPGGQTPLVGAVVDAIAVPGAPACSISLMRLSDNAVRSHASAQISVSAFSTPPARVQARRTKAVGRWPDLALSAANSHSDFESATSSIGRGAVADDILDWNALNGSGSFADTKTVFQSVSKGPKRIDAASAALDAIQDQSHVNSMLLFTDDDPDEIVDALVSGPSPPSIVGILGARTPFINGQPQTLFLNDSIHETAGAVGLAFSSTGAESTTAEFSPIIGSGSFVAVTEPIPITRARGNMILELGGTNAARHLLRDVSLAQSHQQYSIGGNNSHGNAEATIYVRIEDPSRSIVSGINANGKSVRAPWSIVCELSGGDISKGTLALDTSIDLSKAAEAGMTVTIVKLCDQNNRSILNSDTRHSNQITFSTLSSDLEGAQNNDACYDKVMIDFYSCLIGSSTRGVLVGGGTDRLDVQVSRVPGISVSTQSVI